MSVGTRVALGPLTTRLYGAASGLASSAKQANTLLIGVSLLAAAVIGLFTVVVILTAFQDSEDRSVYTLENLTTLYTNPTIVSAVLNTVGLMLVSVVVSLGFGVPIAWLVERTTLPGKRFVMPAMVTTLLVPGLFTAIGWLYLAHPRIGALNAVFPGTELPFNILAAGGMGFVTGIGYTSLVFVMMSASIRAMDPSLEESAEIHGMSFWSRTCSVTLPLIWPAVLSTAIYVGMIALATFEVPAVLGLRNQNFTFSTLAYNYIQPDAGAPQYGVIGSMSLLMMVVALIASYFYLRVINQSHRYMVVRGKNYRPKLVELGRWAKVGAWGFIGANLLLGLVLPILMLVWISLMPFAQPPSIEALGIITLDHYRDIPWDTFGLAARNTAILTIAAPTITIALGLVMSWVVIKSGSRWGKVVDVFAFLPHAIPSIVFALAAMFLALFYLPDWVPLWGTVSMLVLVYVIARISFPTRVFNNSLLQIHRELDEAGYVFGLGPGKALRWILAPLLAPAIVYTWIFVALLTYRELTLAAFLVTRENQTITTNIFGFVSGDPGIAAALSLFALVFMLPLLALYVVITHRRTEPAGV